MAEHFAAEELIVTDDDSVNSDRRLSRTLTQRYDMHSLRALQELEVVIFEDLCKLCKCDEDDLPCDLDLLAAYNACEDDRHKLVSDMLKGAPGDNTLLVETILDKLKGIEEYSAAARAEADSAVVVKKGAAPKKQSKIN